MFPELSDGQLVIFRKALVCNQHLAMVAKVNLIFVWCCKFVGYISLARDCSWTSTHCRQLICEPSSLSSFRVLHPDGPGTILC